MSGPGEGKRLACLVGRRGTALLVAAALAATSCVGLPAVGSDTPVAQSPTSTAVSHVSGTPTASPTVTPAGEPAATPLPRPQSTPTASPPPFAPATATAVVAGHRRALDPADFDLVELPTGPPPYPPVLVDARAADLDGDGNAEVFAQIGAAASPATILGNEPAYPVYYGIYGYDGGLRKWVPLRQEVVFWRPLLGYYPAQMWAEFADLTGDGVKEVLLYRRQSGAASQTRFEVLALSGRKLATLLAVEAERIYLLRGGASRELIGPAGEPALATADGQATLVASSPAYAPRDPACCPTKTRLTFYAWNGREFAVVREDVRDGYPALPAVVP